MKVVILCGGKGTRLYQETEHRPKPMMPIGTRPILWHIMRHYAQYGHTEFILCLGYKGAMIKEYFRNIRWQDEDVTLEIGKEPLYHGEFIEKDWKITFAETGQDSMTAYRLKQIEKYLLKDEHFLLTYGDGLSNVDIDSTVKAHKNSGKICTITAVHPPGRFGEMLIGEDNQITSFKEKPQHDSGWINGGFMVCSREIFEYLPDEPSVMLEDGPIESLVEQNQVCAYKHSGFWHHMDNLYEYNHLNALWQSGNPPWICE